MHCFDNQTNSIDNYVVFQQNWPVLNANAKRGSGGVAIAVSKYIMQGHSVQGAYMTNTDGLLGIKIIDNKTCLS